MAEADEFLALRERIATALLQRDYPGASIEDGDYESHLMLAQADTVLDALGIELVGVATEAGITSGGDFVATSASNASPGDVPLYVLRGEASDGR